MDFHLALEMISSKDINTPMEWRPDIHRCFQFGASCPKETPNLVARHMKTGDFFQVWLVANYSRMNNASALTARGTDTVGRCGIIPCQELNYHRLPGHVIAAGGGVADVRFLSAGRRSPLQTCSRCSIACTHPLARPWRRRRAMPSGLASWELQRLRESSWAKFPTVSDVC